MKKKQLPLSHVYKLLEPGPVVLVSSSRKQRHNIMTMSWHTMMDFEPPVIGCVISNRDYTFDIIQSTKQCVINIPDVSLAREVVACGNTCGKKIDKFTKFGLTAVPAAVVDAPLIDECFANLECKIIDTRMVNKYNLFILEVVKAWTHTTKKRFKTIHHAGNGVFVVDGKILKLPSKMK